MFCLSSRIQIAGCLLLLALNARAQQVTQINPTTIKFRGMSMGDHTHSLSVGDSATVILNTTTTAENWGNWTSRSVPSPCDKSHTLYGISFYDGNHAAVIADAGLIFFTANRGTTWKQSGAGVTNQTFRGIEHTPTGAFLIVGDSGIILRSADSGKSWTRINSSTTLSIKAIAIGSTGRGYFVGAGGLIGTTTDFGITWPVVTNSLSLGYKTTFPVTLRGVAISRGDTAIAVGDSGAVAITHNGLAWSSVEVLSSTASLARSLRRSISFLGVTFGNELGTEQWAIYSESDLTADVSPGSDSLEISNSFVLSGDADGGIDQIAWRYDCGTSSDSTIQAGGAFESLFMNNHPLGTVFQNFLFASFDSAGTGYASGTGGTFLKTTDNGYSWSTTFNNTDDKATDIYTFDETHAFAVGWAGSLFRTSNGGTVWDTSIIDPNYDRLHSIAHPANNIFVVCGDYGTMLRSTDNSLTWQPITVFTTEFLEALAFSTPEIGVSVGTSGTILRTTDQGLTWSDVKNPLTGTSTSYRHVAAFPSGIYYATTDSAGLYRSTDEGQNWSAVTAVPQTLAMSFYNERIGVIAETAWSSAIVNDTMRFAFTRDGFATKPTRFNIPIVNNSRMTFHFLDSNSFLCFGSDGFVVKVDMSQSGVQTTNLTPQISPIQAFPNPSSSHVATIEYNLDRSGQTMIELLDELGERVQTVFEGEQERGHYTQQIKISQGLHGAFFVRVLSGSHVEMLPIVVE